jgi:hypothetical protein
MSHPRDDQKKIPPRKGRSKDEAAQRKPYSPPLLREFGSVSELTQGKLTHGTDQGPGRQN